MPSKIAITARQRRSSESVLWYQYICSKVCFRLDHAAYTRPHVNIGLTPEPWHLQGLTTTPQICLMLVGYIYRNCSHTFDSDSNPLIITSVSGDLNATAKCNVMQAPKPHRIW